MRLHTLKYSEFESGDQQWSLGGLQLGPRNLIVGKNATGKTRALNVIDGLSLQLAGRQGPALSGTYDTHFIENGRDLRYELKYADQTVLTERFSIDGVTYLDRGPGGAGTIWASKIGSGANVEFQTPPNQLAAVARRDAIQHAFLEPLHAWGSSVRHYHFGTSLGKESLAVIVGPRALPPDERDPNAAIALFRVADKEFGEPFQKAIIRDLESVGYSIERIGLGPLVSARIVTNAPGEVVGLYVKEKTLPGITDQASISQGMFRALALFIHVNFCQFKKSATCLLIDDIGEGLDFERSCLLIDALREKTKDDLIQLVLTTNDRFVMNRVPLEEWSVLQRTGGSVSVRNYENSKAIFEEFKFTGLSNFSFLEMDVLNGPLGAGKHA